MIIVTSTFTADVMGPSLQSLLRKFCNQEPQFIYNQLVQQAILASSESNKNVDGLNVMLIRLSDLFNPHHTEEVSQQRESELLLAINTLHTNMQVPLLTLRAMEGRRPRRVVPDRPRFTESARRDV